VQSVFAGGLLCDRGRDLRAPARLLCIRSCSTVFQRRTSLLYEIPYTAQPQHNTTPPQPKHRSTTPTHYHAAIQHTTSHDNTTLPHNHSTTTQHSLNRQHYTTNAQQTNYLFSHFTSGAQSTSGGNSGAESVGGGAIYCGGCGDHQQQAADAALPTARGNEERHRDEDFGVNAQAWLPRRRGRPKRQIIQINTIHSSIPTFLFGLLDGQNGSQVFLGVVTRRQFQMCTKHIWKSYDKYWLAWERRS